MALFTYKYSVEYSAPHPTASGRYYWTNVYFIDSDFGNPTSDPSNNLLRVATINAVGNWVTVERFRWERVRGAGSLAFDAVLPIPGNRPGFDPAPLANIVHVKAGNKADGHWYKRLRGLLRVSDIVGGMVSPTAIGWLNAFYLSRLAEIPLLNHRFQPVGGMGVLPDVKCFTFRNGTQRSARTVLGDVLE